MGNMPSLVWALIIAFVAVIVYVVLFRHGGMVVAGGVPLLPAGGLRGKRSP